MGKGKTTVVSIKEPSLYTLSEYLRSYYWPNLTNDSFSLESKRTKKYNCMAWAIAITNRSISHDRPYSWLPGISQSPYMVSYIQYFEKLGFKTCDNGNFEKGLEKIVLYSEGEIWTHVAFQLNKEKWASKLGSWEDIYHKDIDCLCGGMYGSKLTFMSRRTNLKRKTKRFLSILWIKIFSIRDLRKFSTSPPYYKR